MAADGVVLVGDPDYEDDVERSGGVVEELRHYGLHAFESIGKLIFKKYFNANILNSKKLHDFCEEGNEISDFVM